MKKRNIIIIAIILGLIVGAVAVYKVYNKPHKDYEAAEAAFSFSADELFDLYNEGHEQAREVTGKVIQVTGIIQETAMAQDNSLNFILAAENAMIGGINARMSSSYSQKEVGYAESNQIKLKCRCLGFDDAVIAEVKLDNCFIEEN